MGVKIEFKNSNLQSTITTLNTIEGLKRYKNASEGAIIHWKKQKEANIPTADENIEFFTEALNLCNSKIKKAIK